LPCAALTVFTHGDSVVPKTSRRFSIDEAHEQANEVVKGKVDIIGLTENAAVPQRWLIAETELARLLNKLIHTYHP